MNTIDCIKSRRSVRKFTEEKVPHEVLEQLVEQSRVFMHNIRFSFVLSRQAVRLPCSQSLG